MTSKEAAVYPTRADRQSETPSARNAQGMYSPDACLFVGNISSRQSKEQQEKDLKEMFSTYGDCYPKVKVDKHKGLPGAFVQFVRIEDATRALELNGKTLHDRPLRIERAKGQRTGCLFLRSGAPITEDAAKDILQGHGALQGLCVEECTIFGHSEKTTACIVTFAFVEDYNDAVNNFQKNGQYCLQKTDLERNPFADGGKPILNWQPGENRTAHINGNAFHRSGPSNYKVHDRGGSRFSHHPFQRGSHHSSPVRDHQPQYYPEDYQYCESGQQYPDYTPPVSQPFVPTSTQPHGGTRLTGEAPPFIPSRNGAYHGPQAPETPYYYPQVNGYNSDNSNYGAPNMGSRRCDSGYSQGHQVDEGPMIVDGHREPINHPPYMVVNGRSYPMDYDLRYSGQYPGQYQRHHQEPYYPEPFHHGQYAQEPYRPPYQQGPGNFMPGRNRLYHPHMNSAYQPVQLPAQPAQPVNTNSTSKEANHTNGESPPNTQHETNPMPEPKSKPSPDSDSEQETLVNESDETESAEDNASDSGDHTDAVPVILIKDREEEEGKGQEANSSPVKSDQSDETVTQQSANGHLDEAGKEHYTNGVELAERRAMNSSSCPAQLASTPSLASTPTLNDSSFTATGRSIAQLVREANIERGLNCDDNTLDEVTRYFEQEEEEKWGRSKDQGKEYKKKDSA